MRHHLRTIGHERYGLLRRRRCGRWRVGGYVTVRRHDGSCSFGGLETCGSVWACPCCRAKVQAGRADELRRLAEWHASQGGETCMLTFTIWHARTDSLEATIRQISGAWRRMLQGREWIETKRRLDVVGYVRALEVTHGPHGWHPHLHVLLLVRPPPTPLGDGSSWIAGGLELDRDWWIDRWRECVRRSFGSRHVPSREHAVEITPGSAGYVAKLGLELAGVGKVAHDGHRTPWQIAADWSRDRSSRDARLWRSYTRASFGRKQLTWSKNLRRLARVAERSDEEIAAEEQGAIVARIWPVEWREVRDEPATLAAILEAAERDGLEGVRRYCRDAKPGLDVPGPDPPRTEDERQVRGAWWRELWRDQRPPLIDPGGAWDELDRLRPVRLRLRADILLGRA